MRTTPFFATAAILVAMPTLAWGQTPPLDRTILPIAQPTSAPITELDARKARAPAPFAITAPAGAPNVVVILIDDMGFGQPSTFGGGVAMPTLDRLAAEGLRYNQFHTTALCSPTRAALKSGRNHHSANVGAVMEIATAFPGYQGQIPNSVAPLAEMLRLNGYGTAAFGKWHETAPWEVSISGPFDRWPNRQGFDKFYGFMGGETNQWAPTLYDGTARVEVPNDPSYHLTTDLANQAITWLQAQQSLTPDKPFFIYFAPGATHAPHHAPKDWIAKYAGKFDAGWDVYREETLRRQIRLGVVPPDTKLAPKPPAVKDWSTLTAEEKTLYARQMEVFAAFAEHTDHEIGRLIAAVEALPDADNTLIIYIAGDNGASAEGSFTGMFNEVSFFNGVPEEFADVMRRMESWGDPSTYPHFSFGWAVAGNTPFAWAKQVASNYGGTRNGMVVRWPKQIRATGQVRRQWHHVVDVAPTILEAAKLPFPEIVNGTRQKPFEGVSFAYSFDAPDAADRHLTQYFEIGGNRAIYHDGWFAGTVHRAPWESKPRAALDQDRWELYDTRRDFSLANDLAAREPGKLEEMKALFMKEALKHSVLPIDDRSIERFNPKIAGRPDLMGDRTSITVFPGMVGIAENAFLNVKNRSHSITADVEIPAGGARGPVIAQGGRFSGWSLYFDRGRPAYAYNWLGRTIYSVTAPETLPAGPATIRVDFAYDGGGLGKGGVAALSVNGSKVAEGRIDNTIPLTFGDEGVDVGADMETTVTEAYTPQDRFSGRIRKIEVGLR